jgi:hypothetical protein
MTVRFDPPDPPEDCALDAAVDLLALEIQDSREADILRALLPHIRKALAAAHLSGYHDGLHDGIAAED